MTVSSIRATFIGMSRTVLSMLAAAAEAFPDRAYALRKTESGWFSRSYSELRDDAITLACSLKPYGIGPGDTAVVLAEGSPEWITAEFATIYLGAMSVPLSIRLVPEELPYRMNHSEAKCLFVSRNTVDTVLAAAPGFERRDLLVVFLDDDTESIQRVEALGEKSGIREVLSLGELLETGRIAAPAERAAFVARETQAREDEVVTISYTSGTTGNPKGIMLTHCNYFVNCEDSVQMFEVPYDFQTLLVLPCDHSFAHTVGIYASLKRGFSLYFVDARGGPMGMLRNIPTNLIETSPHFLLSVPALTANMMKKMISGVRAKGPLISAIFERGLEAGIRYHGNLFHRPSLGTRLRALPAYLLAKLLIFGKLRMAFGANIEYCVGGGALLDLQQQEFFRAIGVPVYQGYGLTEAAPVVSSNNPRECKLGTAGRPAPSVEVRIVREDGSACAPNERGEVVVRGENVMAGYFKNPEATAEAMRAGVLHTGDLGFLDQDGFLSVVGRVKALLISSDGEKYSPEEIEATIAAESPLVAQVMLYNDHCRYTSALIVPEIDEIRRRRAEFTPERLLNELSEAITIFRKDPAFKTRFPGQWVPTTFQVVTEAWSVENRLLNSTSKLVRHKVAEHHSDLIEYMYTDEGSTWHNHGNIDACRVVLG
ncbi:MAG: AMP-dependent synthetase [Spirochaetaceae bacterium]|nr:MAG: AMP-dependent synthetase [Spirochaetaceae bacterium]